MYAKNGDCFRTPRIEPELWASAETCGNRSLCMRCMLQAHAHVSFGVSCILQDNTKVLHLTSRVEIRVQRYINVKTTSIPPVHQVYHKASPKLYPHHNCNTFANPQMLATATMSPRIPYAFSTTWLNDNIHLRQSQLLKHSPYPEQLRRVGLDLFNEDSKLLGRVKALE